MGEVLEGEGQYGDVLLPLSSGGMMPMADANGNVFFVQSYDLGDDRNSVSPVTMTDYTPADIMPRSLSEIVLQGVEIPDGIGMDTIHGGSSPTVTDLESWDMLDFTAFGYAVADAAIAQMMQQGDDVVFADQDVIVTLKDTQLTQVSGDIVLV
ncbi:hypothetical protein ANTHELSMS3_03361 [Antarctobacter heliothermus]|uniref:Uncharacterized protein n=1 Tax=Antarctobacter heliothermus TaxID=74033 RepID=A0A222E719_9RHOB|nr:hypothetical protein [Antarctobacter heliothermus]ASP21994.1 hypothetical protein ANTHELSMS3_03361 [Antarctobacter heliothermus]